MTAIKDLGNFFPIQPNEYFPAYIMRLRYLGKHLSLPNEMLISDIKASTIPDNIYPRSIIPCIKILVPTSIENNNGPINRAVLIDHFSANYWQGFIKPGELNLYNTAIINGHKASNNLFEGEQLLKVFKPLKFCRMCAEDDRKSIGLSYWYSEHQIPTIYTCSKHSSALEHAVWEHKKTLIDNPIISSNNACKLPRVVITPLHVWLDKQSKYLLTQPLPNTRAWVASVRETLYELFEAKYTSRGVVLPSRLINQWGLFLRESFNKLEPTKRYSAELKKFKIQHILFPKAKQTHPMIFLLLIKFAEEYTGENIASYRTEHFKKYSLNCNWLLS